MKKKSRILKASTLSLYCAACILMLASCASTEYKQVVQLKKLNQLEWRDKIMNEKVYKILTLEEWDNAKKTGEITTNLDQQDGFIHLSRSYQLAGTLASFFNEFDSLILLEFEALELGDELIFEEPIPTGERAGKFPHYYAKLETKLIRKSWEINRNGFSLPKEVLIYSESF